MVMAAYVACGCWWRDGGGCVSLFGYCVLVFASSRATWKGSAIGSGLPEWWCWLVGLRQGKLLCVKLHGGMMDTGKATRLLYPPLHGLTINLLSCMPFCLCLAPCVHSDFLQLYPLLLATNGGTLMQTFRFSARVLYICFHLHIMLLLYNLCAFYCATPSRYG